MIHITIKEKAGIYRLYADGVRFDSGSSHQISYMLQKKYGAAVCELLMPLEYCEYLQEYADNWSADGGCLMDEYYRYLCTGVTANASMSIALAEKLAYPAYTAMVDAGFERSYSFYMSVAAARLSTDQHNKEVMEIMSKHFNFK